MNIKISKQQIEEIAKKIYSINKKENHITSCKLANRAAIKRAAFIKGFEFCIKHIKEL